MVVNFTAKGQVLIQNIWLCSFSGNTAPPPKPTPPNYTGGRGTAWILPAMPVPQNSATRNAPLTA